MFLHFKSFVLIVSLIFVSIFGTFAQAIAPQSTPNKEEKKEKQAKNNTNTAITGEQVAESAILIYGAYVGGRPGLNQIRKSLVERGKIVLNNADGTTESANYEKRVLRGESLEKERVRLDQEFPSSKFALIYKDNKIVGLFNDSVFTPRDEAAKAFSNQIWRGIESLLRYQENGAKVVVGGREKFMGVEYFVVDLTDKENRTTRFFVSTKSFRVMWLEYTEDGVKYTRKFYDYRYAQGTLFPYRNVLFADGKQIEETTILTITYGQRIEEDIFQIS